MGRSIRFALEIQRPPETAFQGSLFSARGAPDPSAAFRASLPDDLRASLRIAGVPPRHGAACLKFLLEDQPIDPNAARWLGDPANARRWRKRIEATDFGEGVAARQAQERCAALLEYARTLRRWPHSADTGLRRQRGRGGAFDLTSLPPLPSQLRAFRAALHEVALEARNRFYQAAAAPVRATHRDANATIEVLGCLRLHFDAHARAIRVERRDGLHWSAVAVSASLTRPLRTDEWCKAFAGRLLPTLRVALGRAMADAHTLETARDWIVSVLQRLCARSGVMEKIRSEVRAAYPLDPQVMAMVRGCMPELPAPGLSARTYSLMWTHAAIVHERLRTSAQLAPVWWLALQAGWLAIEDDYDKLRDAFRGHRAGFSNGLWLLLCRCAGDLLGGLRGREHKEVPDEVLHALGSYAEVLVLMRRTEPLPRELVHALFTRNDPVRLAQLPPQLLCGIAQRATALSATALTAFIEEEMLPVVRWYGEHAARAVVVPQRASWNWFLTHYHQWTELERLRHATCRWTHGIDAMRWLELDVVPIRDSATLWLEGELMRNCLSNYEKICTAGQYILYSMRMPGRKRPIAHIGVKRGNDGRPRLDQVKAFANRSVNLWIYTFAQDLADRDGHFRSDGEEG